MKLSYRMPFDGFATLVVEDEQGRRVRDLIGMAPRSKGRQTDYWDCLGEDGKLVSPGRYRWRGLMHQGIDPVYEATYGTPGIPPWDTGDGTGAWLSDLNAPKAVAASKDLMVLGAERAESAGEIMATPRLWGTATITP